ncbi:MAG: S8 family serine peptidase [Nanoarchaeota archaeon]
MKGTLFWEDKAIPTLFVALIVIYGAAIGTQSGLSYTGMATTTYCGLSKVWCPEFSKCLYTCDKKPLTTCGSYGDVDGDAWISSNDAQIIYSTALRQLNPRLDSGQLEIADVSDIPGRNSTYYDVNLVDYQIVNQYVYGKRSTFPVCGGATIQIYVFNDKNKNGIPDVGERFQGSIPFNSNVATIIEHGETTEDITPLMSSSTAAYSRGIKTGIDYRYTITPATGWQLTKHSTKTPQIGCTKIWTSYACEYQEQNTKPFNLNEGQTTTLYIGLTKIPGIITTQRTAVPITQPTPPLPSDQPIQGPITSTPDINQLGYIPGRIIVKYKSEPNVRINSGYIGSTRMAFLGEPYVATQFNSVNVLNKEFSVTNQYSILDSTKTTQEQWAETKKKYPKRAARSPLNSQPPDMDNIYVMTVNEQTDLNKLLTSYQSDPNIEFAERVYFRKTFATPTDNYFQNQWHHKTIESEKAWDITTGSADIIIAVIDTGIDAEHNDLKQKIKHKSSDQIDGIDNDGNGKIDDYSGWDFAELPSQLSSKCRDPDCYTEDNDPTDAHGHGTGTSGTVAAQANNNGVVGACWNCMILPLRAGIRVINNNGDIDGYVDDNAIVKSIMYAADNGADVISMSFGGPEEVNAFKIALDYAASLGVILVAAAGNDGNYGNPVSYPGYYDNVIAVAATDPQDRLTSFSEYGSWVDIAAPGAGIYTDSPGQTVKAISGTSFSTPMVAGVIGLMLSKNPALTDAQVKSILYQTVDPINYANSRRINGGRVNAFKALQMVQNGNQPPTACTNGQCTTGATEQCIDDKNAKKCDNECWTIYQKCDGTTQKCSASATGTQCTTIQQPPVNNCGANGINTATGKCDLACGANEHCNGKATGAILQTCASGNTGILDLCSNNCQPTDRPDLACGIQTIAGCTGDDSCSNIKAGTSGCDQNCKQTGSLLPDLIVQNPGVSGTLKPGETVTLTAAIKNIGKSTAQASKTSFRLDNGATLIIVLQTFQAPTGQLAAESSETVLASWSATSGPHSLEVCADSGHVVVETDENNCQTYTFTVQNTQSCPATTTWCSQFSNCLKNCNTKPIMTNCGSYGDVDMDGLISYNDSITVLNFVAEAQQLNGEQLERADVTDTTTKASGSVDVTSVDSLQILRYLEGFTQRFLVCDAK